MDAVEEALPPPVEPEAYEPEVVKRLRAMIGVLLGERLSRG